MNSEIAIKIGITNNTLNIINENSIDLAPESFSIRSCVNANIEYAEILKLIQYVHNCTLYIAQDMYEVIISNKPPVTIEAQESLKKKTLN